MFEYYFNENYMASEVVSHTQEEYHTYCIITTMLCTLIDGKVQKSLQKRRTIVRFTLIKLCQGNYLKSKTSGFS